MCNDPVAESVSVVPGATPMFCVHYSDGGASDPLPMKQLRGRARQLAQILLQTTTAVCDKHPVGLRGRRRRLQVNSAGTEEPLSKRPRKHSKKRKASFSRIRKADDEHRVARNIAVTKCKNKMRSLVPEPEGEQPPASAAAAVRMPRPLGPFGSLSDAQRLQQSIDEEWKRELEDDADEIAAFPQIPSDERIRYSLQRWRHAMSSPAIDLAVCAVCAQRCAVAQVHTLTVSGDDSDGAPHIGEKLLSFMRSRLQHNPVMPSQLSATLPPGQFVLLNACAFANKVFVCTGLAMLEGLALDDDGLNTTARTINVCDTCLGALNSRTIPKLSLKNGLEIGRVPDCLRGLTWAEQRLISVYNVHLHMVHFRNEDVPGEKYTLYDGQRQPHFKGSAFCVPQDVISVRNILPPASADIVDIIQVSPVCTQLVS